MKKRANVPIRHNKLVISNFILELCDFRDKNHPNTTPDAFDKVNNNPLRALTVNGVAIEKDMNLVGSDETQAIIKTSAKIER